MFFCLFVFCQRAKHTDVVEVANATLLLAKDSLQRAAVNGCLVYSHCCHGHLTPEQTFMNTRLPIRFSLIAVQTYQAALGQPFVQIQIISNKKKTHKEMFIYLSSVEKTVTN